MSKLKELFSPKDMSSGAPWKRIALFAFPLLIGNFAQQLYNTVDTVVVGNSRWGYNALAAVGNAMPVLNLLLALFVGIAVGAGIQVSQYFGAKDRRALAKTIGNCITLAGIATAVITLAGPLLTGPMLRALDTLPEMFDGCKAYLDIFFYGIVGFFFYNIFAGILRGLGDSFSALLYLMITAALNIVLDLLFVEKMGVAGVALATVIAQMISALLCLRKLLSLKDVFTLSLSDLKPEKKYMDRIISLGLPSGVTQAVMSMSMMVVQRLINGFGDAMFVACSVLVMRVDGYAMLPNMSFGQAMGTYAGQNIGAGKIDRLYLGTRQGLIMALLTSLAITPLMLLFGPALMRLFTPEQELIRMSMNMLFILAAGYIAVSVSQVLQGVMRGAGDTMTPMWISFGTTIFLRVPLAYGLVAAADKLGASRSLQEKLVFVSLLCAWLIGMVISVLLYRRGGWKKKQVNAIAAQLEAEARTRK